MGKGRIVKIEFAAPVKAWYYTSGGPMLSNTPLWIVLTYGGCMFDVATLALEFYSPPQRPDHWDWAILAGLFTGAGFMFSGVFSFSLLGA
jgi:hypothetical protein